jgi:hypothetical protein
MGDITAGDSTGITAVGGVATFYPLRSQTAGSDSTRVTDIIGEATSCIPVANVETCDAMIKYAFQACSEC